MKSENRDALDRLFRRLTADFGIASGQAVIKTIIEELGGLRVTIPDLHDLFREERNRRIITQFNGANHAELAERYGLRVRQIRNIVDGDNKNRTFRED